MNKPRRAILIVDDEEELRDLLATEFKLAGWQVRLASNGKEAIAIVGKENFDVVLSDVRMPGGDGISLLKHIRAIHPSVPKVFLVTAFADVDEKGALALGASGMFSKPFDLVDLVTRVSGV